MRLLDCRTDFWYRASTKSHRGLDGAEAASPPASAIVTPSFFHRSSESTRFNLKAQNAIIQQAEGPTATFDEAVRRGSVEQQYSAKRRKSSSQPYAASHESFVSGTEAESVA